MRARLFLLLAGVLTSFNAWAPPLEWWGKVQPSKGEFALLPEFCSAHFLPQATVDMWRQRFGSPWMHVHHLCGGLNSANKILYGRASGRDRAFYMFHATGEFDYVVRGSPEDFFFRPEIHMTWARILAADNRPAEAVKQYREVIRLRPAAAAPYLGLANTFATLKIKDDAVSAIQEGLAQLPNHEGLRKRYQELTGKAYLPPASTSTTTAPPETGKSTTQPDAAQTGGATNDNAKGESTDKAK